MIVYTRPVTKAHRFTHPIADRFVAVLRRRWLQLVERVRGKTTASVIEPAIAAGRIEPVLAATSELVTGTETAVREVSEEIVRRMGQESAARLGSTFFTTNPHAVNAVSGVVRDALSGIQNADRRAVEEILRQGLLEGRSARQTAMAIRDVIGLTPRQAQALDRFRASLEEQGVPRMRILEQVDRMRRRQIARRAETIARTETIRAQNAGQLAAWRQAREQGVLSPLAILEREFQTGDGNTVLHPPAHPRCRCDLALKTVDGRPVTVWVVTPDDRLCPICRPMPGLNPPPRRAQAMEVARG